MHGAHDVFRQIKRDVTCCEGKSEATGIRVSACETVLEPSERLQCGQIGISTELSGRYP
jgi:hypothetical protein